MREKRSYYATAVIAGVMAVAAIYLHSPFTLRADTNPGKDLFERRCTGCHALDIEKTGPRLRGVFGRAAGSLPSFPYSQAIRNSHVVWEAKSLDRWLTDPDAYIPDNDMAFRVTSPDERRAIIEYLREISRQ